MHDTTVLRLKNSLKVERHRCTTLQNAARMPPNLIFHAAELNPNGNKTYTWNGAENTEYGSDSTAK